MPTEPGERFFGLTGEVRVEWVLRSHDEMLESMQERSVKLVSSIPPISTSSPYPSIILQFEGAFFPPHVCCSLEFGCRTEKMHWIERVSSTRPHSCIARRSLSRTLSAPIALFRIEK